MASLGIKFHKKHVAEGANTLRGGKAKYSAKTLQGNFYEDRYTKGFEGPRPSCSTEYESRMRETANKPLAPFATALIEKEADMQDRFDYENLVQPDTRYNDRDWSSVAQLSFQGPVDDSERKSTVDGDEPGRVTYSMVSSSLTRDTAAMEEYRKRWINDGEGARGRRFETTTSAAINASAGRDERFAVRTTRALPGVPKAVELFRAKIVARGGMDGIRSMGRLLRILDDNGDGKLSREEFKYGLMDFGLSFSPDEFDELWKYLDRDRSGTVDSTEFYRGLRGGMNGKRTELVDMAFGVMDRDGSGVVTVADIADVYDVSGNPEVIEGKISKEAGLERFLGNWEKNSLEKDGKVTLEEFRSYFSDLSAAIDSDKYFELMIRNSFHMSGGEGQAENTTCTRCLVTHKDGHKSVEEVKNDMFMRRDDIPGIISRLKRQGIDAVSVSLDF